MEDDLKILKVEYLSNCLLDHTLIFRKTTLMEDDLKILKVEFNQPYLINPQNKDDLNGRQPQNIKSGISQNPLIISYSNFKLKLI